MITDTHEWSRLPQEYLESAFSSKPPKKPTRALGYARVTDDGRIRELTKFEERLKAKEEWEEEKAMWERHARLERMATGLFQAEPPSGEDAAFVEVTKLRLDSPLTALDLYKLDKPPYWEVTWGSRPTKGMVVDGLPGIVYYYAPHCGRDESLQELLVYFNVYLADVYEGWILSCHCAYGELYFKTFRRYKPIFRRIIGSFRRLRVA